MITTEKKEIESSPKVASKIVLDDCNTPEIHLEFKSQGYINTWLRIDGELVGAIDNLNGKIEIKIFSDKVVRVAKVFNNNEKITKNVYGDNQHQISLEYQKVFKE